MLSKLPTSIAIFGPGLMGASLLMALRAKSPDTRLGAWGRRDEALGQLHALGLVDFASTDAREVAAQTEGAILCVPVDKMTDVARNIAGALPAGAVVTDVGSVKFSIVRDLEKIFRGVADFVGSHPMCGSEATGLSAARPDLYAGAVCVVTPTATSSLDAVDKVVDLWKTVGGREKIMTPEEHDRATALASHVPHVAAAALVELLFSSDEAARELCASGFRDTTRVASGSPSLWEAILRENRREVAVGLDGLAKLLQSFAAHLEAGDMKKVREVLEAARDHRAELLGS